MQATKYNILCMYLFLWSFGCIKSIIIMDNNKLEEDQM